MVQLFYTKIQNIHYWGGREERRGCHCHPSDLLCWLSVIWSGAPTDSLGKVCQEVLRKKVCLEVALFVLGGGDVTGGESLLYPHDVGEVCDYCQKRGVFENLN
jgi:hypothetical protein